MDLLRNPTTKLRDDEKLIIEELLSLSPTEHVNAISAGLAERQNLCSVCTAATDQISDFIFSFDRPLEERPKPDPLWPLEHNLNSLRAVFDGFRVLPPETVGVHADDKLPPDIVLHHREAKTILNHARHCALCQLIKVAIVMDTSRKRGFPYDSPKSRLQHVFGLLRGEEHGFMLHSALLELWHSKDPIFLHLSDINKFGQDSKHFNKFTLDSIRIVWQRPRGAHQDDRRHVVYTMLNTFLPTACNEDVKPYIAGRPPIRSSASLQSFDIIRTWMQQCKEGHSWCMKSIGRDILDPSECFELPTRLIDTGQPGSTSEPRLIDTKGYPAGQWVALSHCWGEPKNHPLMTTTKNIQDHMKGISFSSLPKTFVDAIIVTRALGLRYLWIDSLCIIQDSEEDWLAESKDMGLIYEQAVLTIAATGAKDSTNGLFLPRDYGCLPILSVPVPLIRKQADGGRPCIVGKYNIAIEWRQEPFIQPMHPSFSPLAARG